MTIHCLFLNGHPTKSRVAYQRLYYHKLHTGALLGCLNDVITTLDAGSGQIGEKDPARLNEINSTKKFPFVI